MDYFIDFFYQGGPRSCVHIDLPTPIVWCSRCGANCDVTMAIEANTVQFTCGHCDTHTSEAVYLQLPTNTAQLHKILTRAKYLDANSAWPRLYYEPDVTFLLTLLWC